MRAPAASRRASTAELPPLVCTDRYRCSGCSLTFTDPVEWRRQDELHADSASSQRIPARRITRTQLEHAIAVLIGNAPAEFTLAPGVWNMAVPAVPLVVPSELLQRRRPVQRRDPA